MDKVKIPKCIKSFTGKHSMIKFEYDPGLGKYIVTLKRCGFCGLIDDRKLKNDER